MRYTRLPTAGTPSRCDYQQSTTASIVNAAAVSTNCHYHCDIIEVTSSKLASWDISEICQRRSTIYVFLCYWNVFTLRPRHLRRFSASAHAQLYNYVLNRLSFRSQRGMHNNQQAMPLIYTGMDELVRDYNPCSAFAPVKVAHVEFACAINTAGKNLYLFNIIYDRMQINVWWLSR